MVSSSFLVWKKGCSRLGSVSLPKPDSSWKLGPGDLFVLLGPSGSGRRACLAQFRALLDSGGGKGWEVTCPDYALWLWRESSLTTCSVWEYLAFSLRLSGVRVETDTLWKILSLLDLKDLWEVSTSSLQPWDKVKLALAEQLLEGKRLILVDDFSEFLDREFYPQFQKIIYALLDFGLMVIACVPSLKMFEEGVRAVWVMAEGEVIATSVIQGERLELPEYLSVEVIFLDRYEGVERFLRSHEKVYHLYYDEQHRERAQFLFSGTKEEIDELLERLLEQQAKIVSFSVKNNFLQSGH